MQASMASLFGCFLMITNATPLARADQVDSPRYQGWAKFAVGSTEVLSGEIETIVNGAVLKTPTEAIVKLVEKTDDHVKTETVTTLIVMGHSQASPASTQILPAKVDKDDVAFIGHEKVDAAGKTFDGTVYEVLSRDNPPAVDKVKIDIANDVPGGLIKMNFKSAQFSVTLLLKSFEIK